MAAESQGDGNASLESIVDSLFASTRDPLTNTRLDALPEEIALLLSAIRLDSRITIAPGNDINSYRVTHNLMSLTFPNAVTPVTFEIPTLGLPVSSVSGILATLKAGQLAIPSHGFTLRLGTTARYAFETSSLKSRGTENTTELITQVFALAHKSVANDELSGCAAMDAVLCDRIQRAQGCLLAACQDGLDALAGKLENTFDRLNGAGLDFHLLSGSTPVVDFDGDGLVDALGLGASVNGPAAPALWSAAIDAQGSSYVVYGSWTASHSLQ